MADVNKLAPFILKWEGKFADDPDDRGGATNMGVTISTWRQVGYDKDGDGDIDVNDLKLLTRDDVISRVLKPHYWDRWKADLITNQNIANILVDWVWCSGSWGIKIPQKILGVKQDGIVGIKTINAINSRSNQRTLFTAIRNSRIDFINELCRKNKSQLKFKNGWINRLNDLHYV